jgi:hypothetical protein
LLDSLLQEYYREKSFDCGNTAEVTVCKVGPGAMAGEPAHTDKKEKQIFLIYEEIQNGAVEKSYNANGILTYWEICILGSPSTYCV